MQETWETWIQSQGPEDPWSRTWQPSPVFLPGESHGHSPLWRATVHRITKSQTQPKWLAQMHAMSICLPHRTPWPGPSVRQEDMNISPLEADRNQEMFDFTPSPFCIKETWILTQARWFFETQTHHLGFLAFQIKSLFLAPTTCLPSWPAIWYTTKKK